MDKKFVAIMGVLIVAAGTFAYFSYQEKNSSETSEIPGEWINFELTDVLTEKDFKISDFQDKAILIESFAVWCPTCTSQQKEIKKLHELPEIGEKVISISIDADPNEDAEKVKEHIERNGFDWYYAVAPSDMTRLMIEQFGIGIVNAPSAPVVLVCNGNVKKLSSGLKDFQELKSEVDGCLQQ